jgi:hypothetical protein
MFVADILDDLDLADRILDVTTYSRGSIGSLSRARTLNGCVPEMPVQSVPWQAESSHLASRRWSDSFAWSPGVSLTNASLEYAPVGNAGVRALSDPIAKAMLRIAGLEALSGQIAERLDAVERYMQTYRQYCWPVSSLDDLKFAPFHLLAGEGAVHIDKPQTWLMEMIAKLCSADTGSCSRRHSRSSIFKTRRALLKRLFGG